MGQKGKYRFAHCRKAPDRGPLAPMRERRAAHVAELYTECRECLRLIRLGDGNRDSLLGHIAHNRRQIALFR